MKSLQKCDGSMNFSVYMEKSGDSLFLVVYVPRFLVVFRGKDGSEAKNVCTNFNCVIELVKALGK